jgi:hypothetical protein
MTSPRKAVFLLDVDNTMLDNDHVQDDLRNHLECEFGAETRDRYFAILEELYAELGYADYLGALQRYRPIAISSLDYHSLSNQVHHTLATIGWDRSPSEGHTP